jgi:hypothetical protein
LLSIISTSALEGILQWLVALGGIAIRQSGPFISARTAARHWYPIDSACACTPAFCSASAAPFKAANAMQIAEPAMNLAVERDFMGVASSLL